MFKKLISAFSIRLLVSALILTVGMGAGALPQGADAAVGNWATGEWVCSTGTPPLDGGTFAIGVAYDCTFAIAAGRVMTQVVDNSSGTTTSVVNANLLTKGLVVSLVDSNTKVRVQGTPIARSSSTSGESRLRYEFNTDATPAVYIGKEELTFRTELLRANGSVTVSPTQPALGDAVTFTANPTTLPTGYTVAYVWRNSSDGTVLAGQVAATLNYVAAVGNYSVEAYSVTSWTDGTNSVSGVPLTRYSSLDLVGRASVSVERPRPVSVVTTTTTVAPTTTTTAPTTTTVAPTANTIATTSTTISPTSTTVALSALASKYVKAVPGITVTDSVVYRTAPKRVAENSAIIVLTAQQTHTLDVVSQTSSVCLPNDNDLVFINEGTCIADVVNQRTRAVVRTLRTKVVGDSIEELLVGNEIVTLAPVYFDRMSASIDSVALRTLKAIRPQAIKAGSILVMGHSGIINGNSLENQKVAADRAGAVVKVLKTFGVKATFVMRSVGAINPVSTDTSEKAQVRNRRAVIALIP